MLALQNPGEFTVQNNRIQPAQDGKGADSASSHQALTACCTAIVSWELADETVLIDVDCVRLHCALVQPRVGSVEGRKFVFTGSPNLLIVRGKFSDTRYVFSIIEA